jgi:hypothetical protein
MTPTRRDQLLGLVRHVLTFGGGYLIGQGIADAATVEVAVSAIITLVGIGWSFIDKKPR